VAVDVVVQLFEIFDAVRGAGDAIDGSRSKAELFSTRSRSPPAAVTRTSYRTFRRIKAWARRLFPPHPKLANQQSE
jgi:hypothetical protein